jgi:hypothetical protein
VTQLLFNSAPSVDRCNGRRDIANISAVATMLAPFSLCSLPRQRHREKDMEKTTTK